MRHSMAWSSSMRSAMTLTLPVMTSSPTHTVSVIPTHLFVDVILITYRSYRRPPLQNSWLTSPLRSLLWNCRRWWLCEMQYDALGTDFGVTAWLCILLVRRWRCHFWSLRPLTSFVPRNYGCYGVLNTAMQKPIYCSVSNTYWLCITGIALFRACTWSGLFLLLIMQLRWLMLYRRAYILFSFFHWLSSCFD